MSKAELPPDWQESHYRRYAAIGGGVLTLAAGGVLWWRFHHQAEAPEQELARAHRFLETLDNPQVSIHAHKMLVLDIALEAVRAEPISSADLVAHYRQKDPQVLPGTVKKYANYLRDHGWLRRETLHDEIGQRVSLTVHSPALEQLALEAGRYPDLQPIAAVLEERRRTFLQLPKGHDEA